MEILYNISFYVTYNNTRQEERYWLSWYRERFSRHLLEIGVDDLFRMALIFRRGETTVAHPPLSS